MDTSIGLVANNIKNFHFKSGMDLKKNKCYARLDGIGFCNQSIWLSTILNWSNRAFKITDKTVL